jgi:hypothetical protein
MNEKTINIKAKIMEQAHSLVQSVDDAFIAGTSAHEVEEDLFKQLLHRGHQAITLLFVHYGQCDVGETVLMEDKSQLKRLPEPHGREYLSVFGLVELERYVYGSREGQKVAYVPLDARLELPRHKFSYLLQNWNQALASEMPYIKVNDTLSHILNLSVPVSSLERTNQNLNKYTETYWDNQAGIEAAEAGQIIVGSADGKGVVIRKSLEEKEEYLLQEENTPKPACIESGTSRKQSGKKKMAILGAVYTVASNTRTPEEVLRSLFLPPDEVSPYADQPARPKPLHKHVRASMHRDAADTLQPARKEIFDWLGQEYGERNPEGKNPNVLLMDGENKLWDMGKGLNVEGEIIEILDIIHACSYVWKAVQALHPKNSIAKNIPLVKEQIRHILEGNTSRVIRSFRWQATHRGITGDGLEKISTACAYMEKNRERMHYHDYLASGYPIASGVIEGACRNVVVDRMECSGMRWVMDGAKSMLNIRCIHLNGDWEDFICFYIQKEQESLYPVTAANDDSFTESMVA